MANPFFRSLVGFALAVLWLAPPVMAQNPNVTVDDQPTAEQKLEEVLELRKAKRYAEAAELIQELIDSARFKLVSLGDGTYADAGQWASDVLMRDRALRKAYVERYSAASARQFDQASAASDRLAALLQVHRQYAATRSGLEAGMDAAGLLLEAGEARAAATLIQSLLRHPDRQEVMQQLQMLRGAAAAYEQDKIVLEEAAEALAELAPQEAEQLEVLASSIVPATIGAMPARVDMGPKPISIRAPLWEQDLATAKNAQQWIQDDKLVIPLVTPSSVIINNGRQLVALDRASGQRAWAVPGDEDSSVQKFIASHQRWRDERAIARAQGKLVAVLGECNGINERRNPDVQPNHLICVDEQTGKTLWRRTAADFRDDEPKRASDRRVGRLNLQHTHFVGTPIMSQDAVFVVLRRASSEGDTQSNWLLAYDAKDGSLLWYRHLALVSLSYTNADSMRITPRLSLHGDTLYFSDTLGTIGAIDRHTGGYHWLRVLPVGSQNTNSIVASTRGITSPPVVTTAGLLVPLSISSDRLMLVDPEDGSVLRSFKQDPKLGKTQYILETSKGVLAVSQTAVSLWDADRGAVAWTFSFGPGETLSGRGDVSLQYAVLPTSQRLLVLDLATGDLIDNTSAVKGSVVVRDGEVLAVSEERLHAYTSWERVYDRLVEQVKSRPDDPAAGLSLASIAMRQDDQALSVLQGVGNALDAVKRQPPRRRAAVASHVFDQLRLLIPQTDDPALRSELYDRLALVTQSAAQEAAYHLDAGLYFAEYSQTQRAIDHLHAVIAEPAFASASYELDGLAQPAGAVARRHIEDLIERFGRGIYARQDALAKAMIDERKAQGPLDAAALAAVARRYPLSPLSGQLLLEAGDAQAQAGRLIAAAVLYKQAVQRSVDDQQRQDATGRLLQFYLDTRRPGFASEFLDRIAKRYEGITPAAGGQALSIEQWRKRIAQVPAEAAKRGTLSASLAAPVLLKGRLISPALGGDPVRNSKRIYLQHNDPSITCRSADEPAKAVWSAKLPADTGEVRLLADESGQVLFWSPKSSQAMAFDAETGKLLWQSATPFSTTLGLNEPGQPAASDSSQDVLIAVSETVLCFAHRDTAQVIAIDRASGELRWQTTLEMTAVTGIAADNWSLAVVGRAGHPQQLRSGMLAILSLSDAQPLLDNGQERIALTPFGVTLYDQRATVLGSSGVMAFDLPSSRTRWTYRFSAHRLTGTYAVAGQRIAVETTNGEVHLLDGTNQGKPMGVVSVRGRGMQSLATLRAIGDAVWCLSPRGVIRMGPSDVVDWTDAIQSPDTTPSALVVGEDHVAVIAQPSLAPQANGLTLNLLESAGGRFVEQYQIGPLPEIAQAEQTAHFGTGLAIPVGDQTLIIPPAKPGN